MPRTAPTASADPGKARELFERGLAHSMRQENDEAIACLEDAVAADPGMDKAHALLGELMLGKGQGGTAVGFYMFAILTNKAEKAYKLRFLELMNNTACVRFNPQMKAILQECLRTPGLPLQNMRATWHSLIATDPLYRPLMKAAAKRDFAAFVKVMRKSNVAQALLEDWFLLGLKNFVISDLLFETALVRLRRLLLEETLTPNRHGIFAPSQALALACALSHYCFETDYIFDLSEEEGRLSQDLRRQIEFSTAPESSEKLAALACYMPLWKLGNAQHLLAFARDAGPVAEILRVQIAERLAIEEAKKTIPQAASMDNAVSLEVRGQYEDFPYPRWQNISTRIKNEATEGYLRDVPNARILVAGCGTGAEAIELACVFPHAEITAIDLSLTSLGYAVRKSSDYGLANISFRHADILTLDPSWGSFDYIASSGVLHHMEDPVRGWRILAGLLKQRGLMRIGLYSETARLPIVAAREAIARKSYAPDAEGIRRFRKDAPRLLRSQDFKSISRARDYYYTPECRDLLFHVQEHRFTLPQVKSILDELGLTFLGFYLTEEVLAQYRRKFPSDPGALDLGNWDVFERKNPDTFRSMYRFWCRKA